MSACTFLTFCNTRLTDLTLAVYALYACEVSFAYCDFYK